MRIETKNLTYTYQDKTILQDTTLTLPNKGVTVITGPNGVGKTTLAELLAHQRKPNSGTVHTPKHTVLLTQHFTVPNDAPITAGEYLEATQTDTEKIGIEPPLTKQLRDMSGGQLQRLRVAEAIRQHPDLLILDEPIANIDKEAANTIQNAIQTHREHTPTIIITHNINFITEIADHTYCFHKDHIHRIQPGDTEHLIKSIYPDIPL